MDVKKHASGDINTHGGGETPPCTGLTPDALLEVQKSVLAENTQTGVSTRNFPIFLSLWEKDYIESYHTNPMLLVIMTECIHYRFGI